MNIAVFVSGEGTNLQALIDYEKTTNGCPYHIELVVSNNLNARAVKRAEANGITLWPAAVAAVPIEIPEGEKHWRPYTIEEKRSIISDEALRGCRLYSIGLIVLAGFLTVLTGDIITEYAGRIVNLHPALLPKFGGVGMWGRHVHEAVLAAGEKESGCTVHLVDSGCDTGRILVQRRVPVLPSDTPETLSARIAPQEHIAIVEGVLMAIREINAERG